MPTNALYVYGIVKFGIDLDWKESGINGKAVRLINKGKFSALAHYCQAKPYLSEDPNKIKELIITHNRILNKAMNDFGGVIPLQFNTMIKKGENLMHYHLKKWLNDDQERLEKIWNKINGKKEYAIRVYCDKSKLSEENSDNAEIKEIEESQQSQSPGLSYLMQAKINSKINNLVQGRIDKFKQSFYNSLKSVTSDIIVSKLRIRLEEQNDSLLSVSVLADQQQIDKIGRMLENPCDENFSAQVIGPFPPYSFVENEKQ